MFFDRIYEKGLAQASYLIGCQATKEAIVIDPKRDIDTYLEIAERENLKITHIAETHIHADFLSGSNAYCNKAVITFTGGNTHYNYLQDIYLNDDSGALNNTFAGGVYHQLITADTDSAVALTPKTGSANYAMIDENPNDGDTTYNAANTAVTDEFNFEALTGTPVVLSLNTYVVARDETVGTDPSLHLHSFVKGSSGTVAKGAERDVPAQTGYVIYADSFETDPDTSDLWDYTDVNALAAGYLLEAD
jgi:hypothetical protein